MHAQIVLCADIRRLLESACHCAAVQLRPDEQFLHRLTDLSPEQLICDLEKKKYYHISTFGKLFFLSFSLIRQRIMILRNINMYINPFNAD